MTIGILTPSRPAELPTKAPAEMSNFSVTFRHVSACAGPTSKKKQTQQTI